MKEEYGLSRLRALTSVDILSVRPFMGRNEVALLTVRAATG